MADIRVLLDKIQFNEQGLIPAVLQDIDTKEVLMLAYMNSDSLLKTIDTGKACFWSRSRQKLWLKGETSGNYQIVKEIRFDCDKDSLLLLVKPAGPACHTGKNTCFYRKLSDGLIEEIDEIDRKTTLISMKEELDLKQKQVDKAVFLYKLYNLITDRKKNPVEGSYTNYLLAEGVDKICKKVGEEASEVIIGAKNASQEEMVYEIGDLIYHLLVLMNFYDIPVIDIMEELESRSK